MSAQTEYSPDFQRFLQLVDKSLVEAAADARELAERTGTPLVVRESAENQADGRTGSDSKPTAEKHNTQ